MKGGSKVARPTQPVRPTATRAASRGERSPSSEWHERRNEAGMLSRHTSAREARTLLERDHARVEELLKRAACSVREDCREDAEARWNELEEALLAHLDVEEMFVIPHLARVNAKEAQSILDEHTRIRCELGDIGIAFELHTVRADAVDAFCARLREHAAHEEALMYPLVETELEHAPLQSLLRRLRRGRGILGGMRDAIVTLSGGDR